MIQNDLELSPIPFIMANYNVTTPSNYREYFPLHVYNVCIIFLPLEDYAAWYLALSILTVMCWFTYLKKNTFLYLDY